MTLFDPFYQHLESFDQFKNVVTPLKKAVDAIWQPHLNGNIPKFMKVVERHAFTSDGDQILDQPVVSTHCEKLTSAYLDNEVRQDFTALMPWRKGPFQINDLHIDAEWRCDMKWARLAGSVDLVGKHVIDIGSGNGYYALRCIGAGAASVTAIDPSVLSVVQFQYLNRFFNRQDVTVLPLALEDVPYKAPAWDVAISMGVLYHRKSPFEHLESLREKLLPGGQLILETLVIAGDVHTVLVPEKRYAMMNNVYFLPSVALLESWLRKAGFESIEVVSVSTTERGEQRLTEWKAGTSLDDYLDPNDPTRTIEGHPIPTRAILTAIKPESDKRLPRYHL